jgi:hypothetical protein
MQSMITDRFIKPGFDFWFSNHEHIRTPFPPEISEEVQEKTTSVFFEWLSGFKEGEVEKVDEHELVEMFETILFNEAIKLVEDEDQRLTILYPFLPRTGDSVNSPENGTGKIIERRTNSTSDQKKTMTLVITKDQSGETWETQIELTA